MKFLIVLLISILIPQKALAADQWFCTDQSSARNGNVFSACGVGESVSEALARDLALNNALGEFKAICDSTTSCKDQPTFVEPKRLSCSLGKYEIWKCYRMIQIIVGK